MKQVRKWSVVSARRDFAGLLRAAEREPQYILRHGSVAGVLASPTVFEARALRPVPPTRTMREALEAIKAAAREERYSFPRISRARWSPEFGRFKRAVSRRHQRHQ